MTPKHFCLLLLAVLAAQTAVAQNEDELQIPVENDNQFPPDNHSDVIEGSGEGVIEEPSDDITPEITEAPPIENIESRILSEDIGAAPSEDEEVCPKPCVCRIEGSTNDFVIDCSGYDLTEFPSPLNEKATVLNIQKNKITEIPKDITILKNLRVLNANDNSIMNLASGSVSELPELVVLKIGNNRLMEFPNDLKNSFGLTKLEELDLGGNDMRTTLTADIFSKFESLHSITLPSTAQDIRQDLCDAAINLVKVCTGSCETESYDCQDEPGDAADVPVLPGMLQPSIDGDFNGYPFSDKAEEAINQNNAEQEISTVTTTKAEVPNIPGEVTPTSVFSFRSAVNKQASDVAPLNSLVEIAQDVSSTTEASVKVGATTTDTKTGGVDKSIIGLVVAGMVVVVAAITIKKNWTSIKKRFASNPNNRTPNEHVGGNANGTTPEQVPLQDKSPV